MELVTGNERRPVVGMPAAASTGLSGTGRRPSWQEATTWYGSLHEELASAATLVAGRRLVATYPRAGCRREYEAAQRLAAKAGIYLVSDDHALNNYDGLPLVVGRPLVHRYARQAIAMAGLWCDPAYLNNPTGVVSVIRHDDGTPWYLMVTGETVAAVEAAATRLLAAVPSHKVPADDFALFAADTLEVIYPWQLHPERSEPPTLQLRLAANDRRSLQLGLRLNRQLDNLQAELGTLRRDDGTPLEGELQLRYTGCYEWDGFFGELRLPNALVELPALPLPPNTACGIWLTVQTGATTLPGCYRGKWRWPSGHRRACDTPGLLQLSRHYARTALPPRRTGSRRTLGKHDLPRSVWRRPRGASGRGDPALCRPCCTSTQRGTGNVLNNLQIVAVGQCRELLPRQSLIPVSDGGEIILQRQVAPVTAPAESLNRNP